MLFVALLFSGKPSNPVMDWESSKSVVYKPIYPRGTFLALHCCQKNIVKLWLCGYPVIHVYSRNTRPSPKSKLANK